MRRLAARPSNPWFPLKLRLEPFCGRIWFKAVLRGIQAVVERLVVSGLLPERIGRLNVIDVLLDLEG